jgi:N-acetylneuraminic acid mutarotase
MRLRRTVSLALAIYPWLFVIPEALARDLTFEDRVNAQEAIDRVRYSHQLGATEPFEEAMPREALEARVRSYLQKSMVLESFWNTKVTPEMLRAEVGRMARTSRMPERLHELFHALGDDPGVIGECLARPAIVDRLSRHFFAHDQRIHSQQKERATDLQREMALGSSDVSAVGASRSTVNLVRGLSGSAPTGRGRPATDAVHPGTRPAGLEVEESEFDRVRARFGPEGEQVALVETEDQFVVAVLEDRTSSTMRIASYAFVKTSWDRWWNSSGVADATGVGRAVLHDERSSIEDGPWQSDSLSVPPLLIPPSAVPPAAVGSCLTDDSWQNGSLGAAWQPRIGQSTTWTGSEMVIWGGTDGSQPFGNGAGYDPATDTWRSISTVGAPAPRWGHSAGWTGGEIVIWGGTSDGYGGLNSGARYDPLRDAWLPVSDINSPPGRYGHTSIWTGRLLIVWGGQASDGSLLNSGGRYDPVRDEWAPTTLTGSPSPRADHSAIWTGEEMVVWGGGSGGSGSRLNTGGRYDPDQDSWTITSTTGAPTRRKGHTAVWTGQFMVVWGGDSFDQSGGLYDPRSDTWSPTVNESASVGCYQHSAVWTGSRMLIWGGWDINSGLPVDAGWSYDPSHDAWSKFTTLNAPTPRYGHAAIWTDQLMIVWGGQELAIHPLVTVGGILVNSGGRYDPTADAWTPVAAIDDAPRARLEYSSVWTGNEMIVWGGAYTQWAYFSLQSGGRYDPVTDDWIATSLDNAPTARQGHEAVWTGREMIIWGGFDVQPTNTGGRYDPLTDSWTATSLVAAPTGRGGHLALWIDDAMFVWGGNAGNDLNTGARYDPTLDRWFPVTTAGAPIPRSQAAGVWTGSEVIVWGGFRSTIGSTNTGGRYDPRLDVWRPVTMTSAPSARSGHTAVWTGREMAIWGGDGSNSGGRYDPVSDTWRPTSTMHAPAGRTSHTAVWTGEFMIVWGGHGPAGFMSSGGRYDPLLDTWSSTATVQAPAGRSSHTAVWTGSRMIVWGGWNGSTVFNSGGQYCACEESRYYADSDGDGHGDGNAADFCEPPSGFVSASDDCDDSDPDVHPSAAERCNGVDDDCDGETDEGFGIGAGCIEQVDACHEVIGTAACLPDGSGTQCKGTPRLHDTTPPMLTCPVDTTLECPASADGLRQATAIDACDPAPAIVTTTGGGLPLGTTSVTWVATDQSGNHASCEQSVLVRDTVPPALDVFTDPASLWPPNHEMVQVHIGWDVHDACDPQPEVSMISVTSGEPDDAPGNNDGATANDIQGADIGTPDTQLLLRSERNGQGLGRVYALTYRAIDRSGNAVPGLATVTVPHDQGHGPEPLLMQVAPTFPGSTDLHVYWPSIVGATGYDVITGDLSSWHVENGVLNLGAVRVLAQSTTMTSVTEPAAVANPAVGQGFFYLIQQRTEQGVAAGYGTESGPWPRVPRSCDGGCPGTSSATAPGGTGGSQPARR